MTATKLTLRRVHARAVLLPLRRPIVSSVGLFRDWPMILIDLYTNEGIVGRSYLEPYLKQSVRYIIPTIEDLGAGHLKGNGWRRSTRSGGHRRAASGRARRHRR